MISKPSRLLAVFKDVKRGFFQYFKCMTVFNFHKHWIFQCEGRVLLKIISINNHPERKLDFRDHDLCGQAFFSGPFNPFILRIMPLTAQSPSAMSNSDKTVSGLQC